VTRKPPNTITSCDRTHLPLAYIRAVALLVLFDAIDLNVFTAPAGPEPKEEK
jgi:hypothetical protein